MVKVCHMIWGHAATGFAAAINFKTLHYLKVIY